MPIKLKGKFYKTAIGQLCYIVFEFEAIKKQYDHKISEDEMFKTTALLFV